MTAGAAPRVSVVMPVHNAGPHLGEQLEALLEQELDEPWELVVADNGSTDGGIAIVEGYRARMPALRVVDAAQRPGPSYARNAGAAHSAGSLLLFCDADDVVGRGWLKAMVAAADAGGALLLCSDDHSLDGERAWRPPQTRANRRGFPYLPWARGGCIGVSREAFEAVGGFDEELHRGEDVDLCWRVQLAGFRCELVPDAVVYYRLRETGGGLLRQQWRFGVSTVDLHRRYRAHGKPTPSLRSVVRGYAWSLTRMPLLLSPHRRRLWIISTGQRAGRLWGSLRYRVWCP